MKDLSYILGRWWHNLTAWNTRGEAIHSPYLFCLVRFNLHDGEFYCWRNLRPTRREKLLFRLANFLYRDDKNLVIRSRDERLCRVLQAVDSRLEVVLDKNLSSLAEFDSGPKTVRAYEPTDEMEGEITTIFDYYELKLAFYDKHYLRRKYRMRL